MHGSNVDKFDAFSSDWGQQETMTLTWIYELDTKMVRGLTLTGDVTLAGGKWIYKVLHFMKVEENEIIETTPSLIGDSFFLEECEEDLLLYGSANEWIGELQKQYGLQFSVYTDHSLMFGQITMSCVSFKYLTQNV